MGKLGAFIAAATLALGGISPAYGYSATASVTFTWASTGTTIGWASYGPNVFPDPSIAGNATEFLSTAGSNATDYYNADFAGRSDYGSGTDDDCLTPLSGYKVALRKYGCRNYQSSLYGYYVLSVTHVAPVADVGPGASASGTLTATDTTLSGVLTVVSTTDEPKGATSSVIGGVRISTSPGNGFDGYNVRTDEGSPFGSAWYGITTSATLKVALTGSFDDTNWIIDGGTVTFRDPGFGCQQTRIHNNEPGALCTAPLPGRAFHADGSSLSWGMDPEQSLTGMADATPIIVRNASGTADLATLSGVLAHLTLDAGGGISTADGEFRSATGETGCFDHIRWGGAPANGISCGTLKVGGLEITGHVNPPGSGDGGGSSSGDGGGSATDALLLALLVASLAPAQRSRIHGFASGSPTKSPW